MLELSADLIRGLDNVTVEKIDLYKDKNILRLVLSGLPEDDNSLVAFSNAIKKLTECDLKIFFVSSHLEKNIADIKSQGSSIHPNNDKKKSITRLPAHTNRRGHWWYILIDGCRCLG